MKKHIVMTGGGSGGHVTPVVPVIEELKKQLDLKVTFLVDKDFQEQARGIFEKAGLEVEVTVIPSGKLRRYSGYGLKDYLKEPSIIGKNFLDLFKIGGGFAESLYLLKKLKPDAVFAKGGFVSLPVGIAAHMLKIPLVIHDSDARPGLTNKVLSRYASRIATGMPLENYPYDKQKSSYTGVPIKAGFHPYTEAERSDFKVRLGFRADQRLVVVTGGSLGSKAINEAILKDLDKLMLQDVAVFHMIGRDKYDPSKLPVYPGYKGVPFVYSDMDKILGAADVVVSRASATTIQELSGLASAVILVPASQLGDQLKNAQVYREDGSAVVLSDKEITDSSALTEEILKLLSDDARRAELSQKLHRYARPQAAKELADRILEVLK